MAKPTRKHFAGFLFEESEQGRFFEQLILRYLGGPFQYEPLASFDNRQRHLFLLKGPAGSALLAEAPENAQGSAFHHQLAFWTKTPDGLHHVIELDAFRWDRHLESIRTGTDPFPGISQRKAKELNEARRREIANKRDRVSLRIGRGSVWRQLAGINKSVIAAAVASLEIGTTSAPAYATPAVPPSDSVDETTRRVHTILTEWLGSVDLDAERRLSFPVGSTRVFVDTRDWSAPGGLVTVFAVTNKHVPKTPELFEYLVAHSENYVFGRLGAWLDDDHAWVVFRQTLLGATLDPIELKNAVGAVASVADELDDEIKARFGGALFHEATPAEPKASTQQELPTGFYL